MSASSAKRLLLLGVPFGLFVLLLSNRIESTSTMAGVPAISTRPAATSAPAPTFAAMSYYDQNCAHCHGPQGSFYGPTLGQKLDDAGLEKAVNDMASGAGNAPLAADQLPVETAFHRSLIMRNPFLSVTKMGDDGKWAGETMPDAKVVLIVGQKRIEATNDDSNWSAQLPPGTKASDVKLTADLAGVTTSINPIKESYSNTTPLPPSAERPK